MKRVHEGLNNYIKSLKGAGEVGVPNVQPRLPVGPDAPLPIGIRPIPSSSQAPKKTNATIVYSRTAMNSTREDEFGAVRVCDVGGVAIPIIEGSLVFTLRCSPATRQPLGQNVKTFSLARVNHILDLEADLPLDDLKRTHDKWCPDGVCNNLDGADPYNEFKDFPISNVAIQGFVRFDTLQLSSKVCNADRVLVGMVKDPERPVYQFKVFTSYEITKQKVPFSLAPESLLKAWTVGRVVDGKQSKNMVTVNVSIDPIAPKRDDWPYKLVPSPADPRAFIKEMVTQYTLEEQLLRMWLDDKGEARLTLIEIQARQRAERANQSFFQAQVAREEVN